MTERGYEGFVRGGGGGPESKSWPRARNYLNPALALVILAGDLNTLPTQDVIDRSGLSLIVDQPTRGESKLDRIYASDPTCYESTKIIKSVVKSDHCAIIAYNGNRRLARDKTTTVCTFRRKTPTQHALFAEHARSEQYLPIAGSVQEAFDSFYTTALSQLNLYYPERQVSMTSREPSFMTPEVKSMLRRKNKLMRSGR